MCGIVGVLGVEPDRARPAAPRMLRALHHRGPDDSGLNEIPVPNHPPVQLALARLAIQDLSPAGHQPMQDHPADPKTPPNWIVFNGEIFNFHELWRELADAGWPCRTRCDTEVILHAYRVWGEKAAEHFHGMFAFVLLDLTRGTAWFCRDRLGFQPLYTHREPSGGLLFASEVRALLAAGPELAPPKVRRSALEAYLAQGAVYGDEAIVEGMELLPPGHWMKTDFGGRVLEKQRYWSPPTPRQMPTFTRADAVRMLGEELRNSIKQWLVADVPLGLFLSGGVDSGALATLIRAESHLPLRTVSIGFDDEEFDETSTANAVAAELKTDHSVLQLRGEEVLRDLPQAIAAVDQPTIDGFNTFFVSREARRSGLTVALSGTGGDELFGGYPTFTYVPQMRHLQNLAGVVGGDLPAWLMRRVNRRGVKRLAELFVRPNEALHRYLLRWELFLPLERRALHPLPAESDPFSGIPNTLLQEMLLLRDSDAINQVSRFELRGFLGQVLLRDADISCLSNQIEVRTPLLEHRIVELALSFPGVWKKSDRRNKPLLIDAVGPRLPKVLLGKPKKGFSFPWKKWMHGPLKERASQVMHEHEVWKRIGFSPEMPRQLWNRFHEGDRCVAPTQILALMVLSDYVQRHNLR